MSEPPRLLDESESATEKALLHAGRSYRSGRETRAKTLAALGIASSGAVVAASGRAAASSSVAKMTGAKLLIAVSAVGAVTLVPVAYRSYHHAAAPRAKAAAPAAPADLPAPPAVAEVPAVVEASAPAGIGTKTDTTTGTTTGTKTGTTTGMTIGTTRPSRPAAPRAAETVSLAQELAALDAARATLARGDARGALLLLDGYDKTCPQGRLRLEAELLRIDALAKSGQAQAAKRHAQTFLRHHPGSVLAARARSYLASGDNLGD